MKLLFIFCNFQTHKAPKAKRFKTISSQTSLLLHNTAAATFVNST